MSTFGKRLEEMIGKRNTNKATIARYCGIAPSQLTKYCKDWHIPQGRILMQICMCLDCSSKWLLDGEGSYEDKFDYSSFSTVAKMEHRIRLESEGDNYLLKIRITKSEIKDMFGAVVSVI